MTEGIVVENQVQRKPRDWASWIVAFLVGAWVIGVSVVAQASAWFLAAAWSEFSLPIGIDSSKIYFGAAVVQGIALLLPLIPLALWWRAPRYRAAFRAWLAAAFFLLLLAGVRLWPSTAPQMTLLLDALGAALFALAVRRLTGGGEWLGRGAPVGIALGVAIGLLLILPWVAWGALGSILDIVLGVLAALAFALAATTVIVRVWLKGISNGDGTPVSGSRGWDLALGGVVVGILLLVMGSAYGFNGTQFLVMLELSALGWLALAVGEVGAARGRNALGMLALLAIVVAAPLLFFDPDGGLLLSLFTPGETLTFAGRAVMLTIPLALAAGVVLAVLSRRSVNWVRAGWAWGAAALMGVVALAVYFFVGQPGLYGDRVFVILKDQADVSSAAQMADYGARRAFVYDTLTTHAAQTQHGLRSTLDRFGIPYTSYYLVNALEVSADLPVQWWLAAQPEVARVIPSPRLRPVPTKLVAEQGSRTTPPSAPEWNLTLIGADRVWNELGARGQGVLVGQSDSGVDGTHPELAAQYRGANGDNNYNWFDPWFHSPSPVDVGGHGTHTLGSVLGKTVGVAPDAQWIGCVNLGRNLGNPALYLDCMQFDFAPFPQNGSAMTQGAPRRGAMVLNNSWGCPPIEGCDAESLQSAVKALRDAGVFVVASAGNDGPQCSTISDPISLYGDVFSVGAVDRNKRPASFSSRGPVEADNSGRVKPDIAAPGVNVLSALPGGTYGANSGTSMAGPHIAGVVALMWSANPKLIGNIDRTAQILRETAVPADLSRVGIVCGDPTATPNDVVGYGVVDAYAAVKQALAEK